MSTSILIADKDLVVARDMGAILISKGYRVPCTVSSGEEAILKAQEVIPDLLSTEVVLNGSVDGVELASLVRTHLKIPVLFVTSHTDNRSFERIWETDPYGFLGKPFTKNDLLNTVKLALLQKQRESQANERALHLRSILGSIQDGIIATNEHGAVTLMNPSAERIIGIREEYCLGKTLSEIWFGPSSEDRTDVLEIRTTTEWKGLAGEKSCQLCLLRDTEIERISGQGLAIRDLAGNTVGAVFILEQSLAADQDQSVSGTTCRIATHQSPEWRDDLKGAMLSHQTDVAESVRDRDKTLKESRSVQEKQQIHEVTSICAGCKKIRDEQGVWLEPEHYLALHCDLLFSHGLCRDCYGFYSKEVDMLDPAYLPK